MSEDISLHDLKGKLYGKARRFVDKSLPEIRVALEDLEGNTYTIQGVITDRREGLLLIRFDVNEGDSDG